MAELVAAVGAAAGFAQLASQLISSVQTINPFYRQVKNAPKHVSSLLEDIDCTSHLLERLSEDSKADEVTLSSLSLTNRILDELQEILQGLNKEVNEKGWKGKLEMGYHESIGKRDAAKGNGREAGTGEVDFERGVITPVAVGVALFAIWNIFGLMHQFH